MSPRGKTRSRCATILAGRPDPRDSTAAEQAPSGHAWYPERRRLRNWADAAGRCVGRRRTGLWRTWKRGTLKCGPPAIRSPRTDGSRIGVRCATSRLPNDTLYAREWRRANERRPESSSIPTRPGTDCRRRPVLEDRMLAGRSPHPAALRAMPATGPVAPAGPAAAAAYMLWWD